MPLDPILSLYIDAYVHAHVYILSDFNIPDITIITPMLYFPEL